jgi:electron transfer flavoprotein alpha subunit
MNMAKNTFVVCEQRGGVLANVSLELLGAATQLAKTTGDKVCAIIAGYKISKLAQTLVEYGADEVFVADDANLKDYLTEPYAQAVAQIVKGQEPNIILFGATSIGRDLAPRLSARLRTGLTADCTKLEADDKGSLFATRPAFGGNLFATIICPDHKPQMATVRPGVMKKNDFVKGRKGEIVECKIDFDKSKFAVKLVEEVCEEKTTEKIEDAKFLVSCGRGVGTEANLKNIAEFAKKIGATVSTSRALVDAGMMPSEKQVGQTGKTVRPDVYLALGISGAVQHLAGMEESEFIVAINKDKGASIFNVAHLGVVGDATKILPYLEKEILAIKNS